jgi:hypothetical protein
MSGSNEVMNEHLKNKPYLHLKIDLSFADLLTPRALYTYYRN